MSFLQGAFQTPMSCQNWVSSRGLFTKDTLCALWNVTTDKRALCLTINGSKIDIR